MPNVLSCPLFHCSFVVRRRLVPYDVYAARRYPDGAALKNVRRAQHRMLTPQADQRLVNQTLLVAPADVQSTTARYLKQYALLLPLFVLPRSSPLTTT